MPDTFILKCPSCQKALKLSERHRGKRVRCNSCKEPVAIPAAEGTPSRSDRSSASSQPTPQRSQPASENPYAAFEDSEFAGRDGSVSDAVVTELRKTKPWVRLIGFLAIIALILATVASVIGTFAMFVSPIGLGSRGLLSLAFQAGVIAIYFFTAKFLVGYSRSIGRLEDTGSPEDLVNALASQRKFWTMQGVLILVAVAIGLLLAVSVMLLGLRI